MRILFVLLTIAAIQSVQAQTENTLFAKASWELNFTGSLGSIESSEEMTSAYYQNGSFSESRKYFELGIIPAYYLIDGLAFEPEVNILTVESIKPSFLLIGNISYTFNVKSSYLFPFLRAGYGVTNSFQIPVTGDLSRASEKMDIGVINLGAGLKTLLSENILLRTELNYRKYSYSQDEMYYKYTLSLSSVALVFGVSVLL